MNQKKILFIHPLGYNPSNAKTDISRKANIMPPLGLACISAYLDRFQIQSHIIDCYAEPKSDVQHPVFLMAKGLLNMQRESSLKLGLFLAVFMFPP